MRTFSKTITAFAAVAACSIGAALAGDPYSQHTSLQPDMAGVAAPVSAPAGTPSEAYASIPRGGRRAGAAKAVAGRSAAGAYFIEFRSRYALSYGHTYAAFGRLDSRGQIIEREVAGLHPAGDSSVPWMLGHLVPVLSETGPSDGDLEDEYISNRYRVTMSESDYNRVVAKIRQMQRSTPLWSATVYNCNSFVGDIARFMGLRADTSTLQTPPNYIGSLKSLNGGKSSIPPGSLG